ncbi:MAG: 2-dehydropantoate 2-reductase [Thermoleophilia bacterium]
MGGFVGVRLAHSGCEVSAVARGATLAAIRERGWRLETGGTLLVEQVRASADPEDLGVQDLVVLAVKATALKQVAARIAPLLGPDTAVLTAMNGVPWWFFDGFGGDYEGMRLQAVDPTGAIAAGIPTRSVLGGVVHGSFAVVEPGLVCHVAGNRLIVGEPDGSDSPRVRAVAHALTKAGLDVTVSPCIQAEIWYKLWGNMTMNPISALTGATCDRILDDPLVNRFCLEVMAEAARIGEKIGCPISQTGEERNALTRELGAFKTSMLRDAEAGRPLELDALLTVVSEIGLKVGEPTPAVDTLLGLARLHARVRGLYPEP